MSLTLPRWTWPRAAYVHVPFCAHHCWYCDFAVVEGREHLADRYLNALAKEIVALGEPLGEPLPVETLFIGGGTPTHLSVDQLARLLRMLRAWLLLAEGGGGEFSIEANPGTLTAEKIGLLAEHGVNRLSLGGQSFQSHVLRFLERDHLPADVRRVVEFARPRIPDISIDLIFGVPGQTLEEWRSDLKQAINLGVQHVSTYGLTYETGTRLWKAAERGTVTRLDEELERAMYGEAMDVLAAAGFEHYEISNFARPGQRSRHNQVYWANHAYFGFGLGAARYLRGRRELNTRDLHTYLQRMEAGQSPVQQSEELGPEERARETAALSVRRAEGIERATFREQTGFELDALCGAAVRRQMDAGLLSDDGTRVCLTREGKLLADLVCASLFG